MTDQTAAPRPVPTFADRTATDAPLPTWLPDEQERDEVTEERDLLRAENANLTAGLRTAQKQRDEALDDRDQARRERDQNAADLQAIADNNDRLRAILAATAEALHLNTGVDPNHIPATAAAARDAARQLAAFRQGVIEDEARVELRHVGQVLTDWRRAFTEEPEHEADRVLVDLIDAGLVPTAASSVPSRRAQEEPASDARRLLDQAIVDGLPLAGGRVRKLLKALRQELVRVDAKRAEKAEG